MTMADSQDLKFALVEFVDDNSIMVVATKWLRDDETTCMLPPVRSSIQADKMARELLPVRSDWVTYKSRTLVKRGQFKTVI